MAKKKPSSQKANRLIAEYLNLSQVKKDAETRLKKLKKELEDMGDLETNRYSMTISVWDQDYFTCGVKTLCEKLGITKTDLKKKKLAMTKENSRPNIKSKEPQEKAS